MKIYTPQTLQRVFVYLLVFFITLGFIETFNKYFFKQDYLLYVQIPCTEDTDECFYSEDDSGSFFYTKLFIRASRVPNCPIEGCDEKVIVSCKNIPKQDCFIEKCTAAEKESCKE